MAANEKDTKFLTIKHACEPCRSFSQKCSHLVKRQRAKFYILRRCIAMLVCWRDRGDP
ncbi:hypothetical protein SLEP1_g48537 [Rubroshorea leprosula]|uniref:DEVIL-like protein n=1 Tax=Rubroshorea leprosula TaxID=152421 RepID=A0AAV5LW09_9ROSI|nr:hypothetical protein SLEP1_g48537 [Rubroshorea leprosula]